MLQDKTISELATLIDRDWKNVSIYARPYLDAMKTINTKNDSYGLSPAHDIVNRFLCNASSYSKRTSNGIVTPADIKKQLKKLI